MRFLKTAAVALTVAVCLLCTSCGTPELKHDTLVYQAREDYAALDSAKVVITNEDTGDIEQEFTFKYDEKDVLTILTTPRTVERNTLSITTESRATLMITENTHIW